MLALLTYAACSFSIAPPAAMRVPAFSPITSSRSSPVNMWTYEEAAAQGIDPGYLQMLETRVGTLVAACEGDSCPLMPQQCVGDRCMMLSEYVRQLEETERMMSAQLQPAGRQQVGPYGQPQQQGGYPPPQQQGGYPPQQGGYPQQQQQQWGGYPQQGGY